MHKRSSSKRTLNWCENICLRCMLPSASLGSAWLSSSHPRLHWVSNMPVIMQRLIFPYAFRIEFPHHNCFWRENINEVPYHRAMVRRWHPFVLVLWFSSSSWLHLSLHYAFPYTFRRIKLGKLAARFFGHCSCPRCVDIPLDHSRPSLPDY